MTESRKITEHDGVTVKRPDILAHEPIAGDFFYAWIPEEHPDFESLRDDLYGWATHRGIEPRELWVGIVPAAKFPFRWKEEFETAYNVGWVSEERWRMRCKAKPERKKALADRKKKQQGS